MSSEMVLSARLELKDNMTATINKANNGFREMERRAQSSLSSVESMAGKGGSALQNIAGRAGNAERALNRLDRRHDVTISARDLATPAVSGISQRLNSLDRSVVVGIDVDVTGAEEVSALQYELDSLGDVTVSAAADAANGSEKIKASGSSLKESFAGGVLAVGGYMSSMGQRIKAGAAAGKEGLASLSNGMHSVSGAATGLMMMGMGGFGIAELADGAINAGHNLYMMSTRMHIAAGEAAQLSRITSMAGVDTNTFMRSIMRLDGQAMKPIKVDKNGVEQISDMQLMLRKYGVTLTDTSGKLKPFDQQLEELSKGYKAASEAGEAEEFVMNTLGARGMALVPVLENLSEYREIAGSVQPIGLDSAKAEETWRELQKLKIQAGQLGLVVANAFMPVAKEIFPMINEQFKGLAKFFSDHKDVASAAAKVATYGLELMAAAKAAQLLFGVLKAGASILSTPFKVLANVIKPGGLAATTAAATAASAAARNMVVNAQTVVVNGRVAGGTPAAPGGTILGPNGKPLPPTPSGKPPAPVPTTAWGRLQESAGKAASGMKSAAKEGMRLGGSIGKLGAAVTLAAGAYTIYNAEEGRKGEAAAGVAGGVTGMVAGTKLGAAAGAALGSVVPGVGTALGAAVGGFLGGIAGYNAGENIGEGIFGRFAGKLNTLNMDMFSLDNINAVREGRKPRTTYFDRKGNQYLIDPTQSEKQRTYYQSWDFGVSTDITTAPRYPHKDDTVITPQEINADYGNPFNSTSGGATTPLFQETLNSMREKAQSAWQQISSDAESAFSNMGTNISNIIDGFLGDDAWAQAEASIQNLKDSGAQSFEELKTSAGNSFNETISNAESACQSIAENFNSAATSASAGWSGVVGWFEANIWGPLKNSAASTASWIGQKISAAAAAIHDAPTASPGDQADDEGAMRSIKGDWTGTTYFTPAYAAGGIASFAAANVAHGLAQINEHGGELIDLPNGSRIYPASTTERIISDELADSSNQVPNITITGNNFVIREEADIAKIAHALASQIFAAESNYGGAY